MINKKTGSKTDKKRIVSFDLDMTLLDQATWKIPDSAIEAVEMLRKDSIIVIASGRNMDGMVAERPCAGNCRRRPAVALRIVVQPLEKRPPQTGFTQSIYIHREAAGKTG